MADDVTAETEEFDRALVSGLMRGVWTSAASAVGLAFLSFCCGIPVIGATPARLLAMAIAFVGVAAAAVSVARLWSMPVEFRAQVPGSQTGLAMALAGVGALLALLQVLGSALWLFLA